jgi:predicted RNA methylase
MTTHGDDPPLEPYLPHVTRFATAHLPSIVEPIRGIAPSELLERWQRWLAEWDVAEVLEAKDPSEPERWFDAETRRGDGIYATPPAIADAMATAAASGEAPMVVDPAAGDGRLLAAAIRETPGATVVGIERHPAMVLATAVRIAKARESTSTVGATDDRVYWDDGLRRDHRWPDGRSSVDAVVMNPPYVGEKGQRDRFRAIAERHPDLADRMSARADLAYLFMHRALDWLAEGGRLVALTPEYWLTATGARTLRQDLMRRSAVRWMIRAPELRLFDDAPGHHSLLARFDRGDLKRTPVTRTLDGMPDDWSEVVRAVEAASAGSKPTEDRYDDRFRPVRWTPFIDGGVQRWGRTLRRAGTRFAQLADDRQGFVSGADRLSARRYRSLEEPPADLEPGDPLFLWNRDELRSSEHGSRLESVAGTVMRPVLRGADLEAGRIIREPPSETRALYIDDELDAGHQAVIEHLSPVRPALESRREVRKGRMPWYRLHWPRDRAEQTGPKLVTARRARRSAFALDLSGSAVSSDCTYVVAPRDVDSAVEYLATLMVALNRPEVTHYLRAFGKTKGALLEFYADPLRRLPLPLKRDGTGLEWIDTWLDPREVEELESRVQDVLRCIETGERR